MRLGLLSQSPGSDHEMGTAELHLSENISNVTHALMLDRLICKEPKPHHGNIPLVKASHLDKPELTEKRTYILLRALMRSQAEEGIKKYDQ